MTERTKSEKQALYPSCDTALMAVLNTGPIHTEAGLKVERRFKSFLNLQKFDTSSKDYKQYVIDMYKICFYEDITGEVASPPIPFGEEALKAIVNPSTNSIN